MTQPRVISHEEHEEAEEARERERARRAQRGFGNIRPANPDTPIEGFAGDFLKVDVMTTNWIVTSEPGYSNSFRGFDFHNGLCRVDGLPKDSDATRKARRKEFFQWFANRPEGYRLYTAEPRRGTPISAGPEPEEDW